MPYEIIETKMYRCTCRACAHTWDTLLLPRRCAKCKCYTWNEAKAAIAKHEYKGRSLTVKEWAAEVGMSYQRLSYRIRQGWPMEDCLYPGKYKAGKVPND